MSGFSSRSGPAATGDAVVVGNLEIRAEKDDNGSLRELGPRSPTCYSSRFIRCDVYGEDNRMGLDIQCHCKGGRNRRSDTLHTL